MNAHTKSCLAQKLSHYAELDEASLESIARFEREERDFAKNDEVYQEGDKNIHLYVVKKGWLYSYADLKDGRRQIVEIHHPGDIVGFPDIAFTERTTVLRAAEDVRLCPFPKKDLDEVFKRAPQLAALLFALGKEKELGTFFSEQERVIQGEDGTPTFSEDMKNRVLPFILPRYVRNSCQTPDSFVVLANVLAELWAGERLGNYPLPAEDEGTSSAQ